MNDGELMQRAIEIARTARRRTAPKPAVGCVIALDGEIVGIGATEAGTQGAHAEVVALREAGDRARGATAYSTLEPCNHHGATPPCTEALVDAGIARVVVAVGDPDPLVAGTGFARLRDAGLTVDTGVETEAAERDLAAYLHHRRTGNAFAVAKVALSLDGRVAAADGSSQWITGEAARADAHELRADSQAIVVGAGTARKDQPALTVRNVARQPARPPLRVLLDARGHTPATGPLFDTTLAPTMVFTTAAAPAESTIAWENAGAKVEVVDRGFEGHGVDFDQVFARLGAEGVLQALVEGGGTLLGALFACGNADRIVAYVAPTLLGTRGAPGFAFNGPDSIVDAPRWNLVDATRVGADVRLTLEPR